VQLAALDGGPEDASRPEQMLLTDDLIERTRPHAVGQWCALNGTSAGGATGRRQVEQLHA
jgi:hypothetical protein